MAEKGQERQPKSLCIILWEYVCGKQTEPTIFKLPECLIYEIFKLLSPVDKVCFTLSCKLFLNILSPTSHQFKFTGPFKAETHSLYLNWPAAARNKLLVRLENARWACCCACLKLHPREEFSCKSLQSPPLERRCMYNAGIVDLCPCLSFTFRDRSRLVKLLKDAAKGAASKSITDRWRKFHVTLTDDGEGLVHECSITRDDYVWTHVEIKLYLSTYEHLRTDTRYTIHMNPGPNRVVSNNPKQLRPNTNIFACPHIELFGHITKIQSWNTEYDYCVRCRTQLDLLPESCQNMISVLVSRALGTSSWPADIEWNNQCREVEY
ncbi:hypothetical protein BGW36DRAFT_355827 [Talaromyces proteolyticus]|uniref:F-box domain-containing protein n=1 Tax=Talaromyces proteolyticus TaxID=1131652 RepID=A0AAD4KY41_9EURO|nr:uncharacterized protein BGW36DRAFT_355827 [Talaromyces proteolyticus]KAH8701672.1 hypothetical protein BGW36DRAFT_355827 [Talaromyces proteolyticus]